MSDHQLSVFQSGIRDNRNRGTVGDFLKDKIELGAKLSIVSAYFTIYAFEALKQELCSIESLNFLFGEPRFIQSIGTKTDRKAFKIEDTGIQLSSRLKQSKLARECQEWIQKKVNIRSIKESNLLHGKMYHIDNNGVKTAILGSSNFTLKGLGLAKVNSNIELNLIVDSERDRQDLKFWFEELWNNHKLVQDVKDEIISYLNQLYQDNAPEFIYYKTLYHLFKQFLDQQAASDLLTKQGHLIDTKIWNLLLDFQKDGVKGAINKIMEYNGCIIADSVGLGKTFEALAIIKYFELLNYKVLVLCPKKLRSNWTIYHAANNSELNILVEDRFNYTVLSHTDLSRDTGYSGDINLETLNRGNYDLVVIDESHNFRNNTKGKRDEDGNVIKKSRYERLMEDIIKKGIPTRVLLLSATPVNTDLKDLRNQINFIVEDKDSAFSQTLGIDSIKQTLTTAQKEFTLWAKKKQHHSNELLENLNSSFFTLLDGLTIARSRQHIKKYYQETIAELGGFPERLKPVSLFSHIDLEDNFLDYDEINEQISDYQLSLFNPSNYVLEEYQHLYEGEVVQNNFTQSNRENYLIGMMKVNFLKRLESSVYSFRITLERTIYKIKKLESKIKNFGQHQTEMVKSEDYEIEDSDDEELQAAFEVGRELKYQLEHLDIDRWLFDLARDRRQLHKLYIQAKDVDVCRDAKLADLKTIIEDKVTNPTLNKQSKENKKVIIFTAFADTAKYLYDALVGWVTTELNINMALVTGGNGGNKTTLARKQTGSFYTPREIVNYMVDESLIAYLQNGLLDPPQPPLRRGENTEKVPLRSGENTENPSLRSGENTKKVPLSKGDLGGSEIEDKLRHLLSYSNDFHEFNDDEVDCLINAIDNLKIIDIACGSGAFPMGILQKLVFILEKLDPNNIKWKQQQKEKAISPVLKDIQVAKQISYEQARDEAIEKLQERLAEIEYEFQNEMDYPRKLFLIENCIFGVDIQPIAVQISKLRFFISLIVDQKVNNNQPNRGILPLPNLETKFVAANSLIGLETQLSLRSPEVIQKEEELKQVRQQHFKARTPKTKKKCRDKDNILRQEISQLLKSTGLESATADTLARWNPYDLNTCSDFFDPNWMFGVTDGFDICIGNPPYVRPHKLSKVFKEKLWRLYSSFVKKADLYSCFVEKTLNILKKTGIGSFILSNGFLRLDSFEKLRILLLQNTSVDLIIDFEDDVFESAIVKTCIFSFTNTYTKNKKIKIARIYSHVNLANLQFANVPQQYYQNKTYQSIFDLSYNNEIVKLKQKIGQNSIDLGNLFDISFGLKTGDDDKFLSFSKDSNEHKSLLRGENIGRYIFDYKGEYVWYVPKIMTSHRRTARPGNKLRFEQPKVLIRDTGNGLMGTYEELNFYVKDVLIISHQQKCTKTLKILVSILNSSLMKFYYETSFPTLHVQRNELAVLPMKLEFDESDQVIKIVDRILEIKRQNPKADTTELEREIDEIVYQLYGLTEEEIRIIEESVKPK
ncbi:Eco57I restriction-modification methylase domain-containing protein [Nodularia spumigena]|uniref:site-specific DNA-methyltransferase (adenine-specific) n=1 Tax=Nodularia spumigena UHCC 0060 TaxID=3110300 RepID=A0ABU5UL83_NODSP|nr:TaqI-like C-terminal specificity domain-containing protein [Nodularia spumigena]MEA5527886.1 TaqI-like C-terminal specificity domain-containing protein [Nodularia spumigena UHCC 0143]MEA5607004.1 TaqI-like C-terminal specificity domain-containing protein [Nodularia spumigena UHCC 0060]MEA5616160.1 TaqI-like C-terminal specificity domain-containing protein [Nodularia spumigena UHCC 0040]